MAEYLMTRRRIITCALFLALGVAVRSWFYRETLLTFEDALITFRYADNLANGLGFVYNPGEFVLGTTSPLWTLLLSALKWVGFPKTVANAKILAVLLDMSTLLILFQTFKAHGYGHIAPIWAALFTTSSGIVPITMSGMETPLLLFTMALAVRGFVGESPLFPVGLAMTILTRIDGTLFAILLLAAAASRDARWALKQTATTILLLIPWFTFSGLYFGAILPQTLKAKSTVYNFDMSTSASPFLERFTPFMEVLHAKFFIKFVSLSLVIVGLVGSGKRYPPLLPLGAFFVVYSLIFMSSGGLIFPWYLTPVIFVHDILLAAGLSFLFEKIGGAQKLRTVPYLKGAAIAGIIYVNMTTLSGRFDVYKEFQGLEEEIRMEIGLWLKDNAGRGGSVLLEPIGYIGYYAGADVRLIDEVGIITPRIVDLRKKGAGWYIQAIRHFKPDYIVEYTRSLEENIAEGTGEVLFRNDVEKKWFFDHYEAIRTFEGSDRYPHIEDKEKRYTVLKAIR